MMDLIGRLLTAVQGKRARLPAALVRLLGDLVNTTSSAKDLLFMLERYESLPIDTKNPSNILDFFQCECLPFLATKVVCSILPSVLLAIQVYLPRSFSSIFFILSSVLSLTMVILSPKGTEDPSKSHSIKGSGTPSAYGG